MEKFDEKQSLEVINGMISMAKKDMRDNGFLYMLWGWFVFVSAAANYILLKVGYFYHFIPWMILMPLGGIISMVYGNREFRRTRVKTYMDTFMGYLWGGFLAVLAVVLAFQQVIGIEKTFPLVMLLYGLSTFVSGGALQFRPLVWGGVACWICGIAAFFVPYDQQLILLAVAVLLGYIVPGHILKANYRSGETV